LLSNSEIRALFEKFWKLDPTRKKKKKFEFFFLAEKKRNPGLFPREEVRKLADNPVGVFQTRRGIGRGGSPNPFLISFQEKKEKGQSCYFNTNFCLTDKSEKKKKKKGNGSTNQTVAIFKVGGKKKKKKKFFLKHPPRKRKEGEINRSKREMAMTFLFGRKPKSCGKKENAAASFLL